MIQTTVQQCVEAHRALRHLSSETKLAARAAWRVGRLLNKVKKVVADFEETQLRMYMEAGGLPDRNNSVTIYAPTRKDETDEQWAPVLAAHQKKVDDLSHSIKQILAEPASIDYDPIPLELFEDARVSPGDLADLEAFLQE